MPMAARQVSCPLCAARVRTLYRTIEMCDYFECHSCDFIFLDPTRCSIIDGGEPLVAYDEEYWQSELATAKERSWGPSLARVAEVILYCRIAINRFVDIGTGPGYLLDSISWALPSSNLRFYGVEMFPPEPRHRTSHPNYVVGSLSAAGRKFDGGCCIEVIEHLTPNMMKDFATQLADCSTPGACYIFNTGLTDYVRKEDPAYLDPLRRGHVSIWSVSAARRIFRAPIFQVHCIPGKTWAFLVEVHDPAAASQEAVTDRIWKPREENLGILNDPRTGSLMYVLGIDTARAYRP